MSRRSIKFTLNHELFENRFLPSSLQPVAVMRPSSAINSSAETSKLLHHQLDKRTNKSFEKGSKSVSGENIKNIIYSDNQDGDRRLDLYLPKSAAPVAGYPVIMAIHGGGWHRFSKDQFAPVVKPLTKQGFAVVAVNYQLSTPSSPSWPGAIVNLDEALGWIHHNALTFRLNPTKVAAIGTSAGGYLAMMLATNPNLQSVKRDVDHFELKQTDDELIRIQAAVSFFGPSDLAECAAESRSGAGKAISRFLGGSSSKYPHRYELASPINHVSKTTAPIMFIHGTDDRLIPINQSEKMASALAAAGVNHHFIEVQGGNHALMGRDLTYMGKSYTSEVVRFLKQVLKI
jgi:acetyl esterase/lipase